MKKELICILLCLLVFLTVIFGGSYGVAEIGTSPLSAKDEITHQYPSIPWVTTTTLAAWLEEPLKKRPLLLDSRKENEFSLSHIKGARRIDPDTPDISRLVWQKNSKLVVYCSIGYRSASVALQLKNFGYQNVFNLEGGIFQWANEGRPLFAGNKQVSKVHQTCYFHGSRCR